MFETVATILFFAVATFAMFYLAASLVSFLQGRKTDTPKLPAVSPCAIEHTLVLIDAQPITHDGTAGTLKLVRCSRCGMHHSYWLAGSWSTSVLLREESELAQLERMAR